MTRNIILKVKKFVDGDGLIAEDYLTKREFEIRLYGIDAPEMSYCNKIKKDEKELHLPAAFLIKLGYMSFEFLKRNVSIGDKCTLIRENNNLQDKYGRSLGYLILKDGRVLNEIMIKRGLRSHTMTFFAKCYQSIKNGIYKLKTKIKDCILL